MTRPDTATELQVRHMLISDPAAAPLRAGLLDECAAGHRRRGLARRVLTELEASAEARGYRRVRLTTGWNQPEATALYEAAGYHHEYGPDNTPGALPHHAFSTDLDAASHATA